MRKLLSTLLLLIPLQAIAAASFYWRGEGTTLSATDDLSPDTSATGNGGVSISSTAAMVGTNGILTTNAQDYYSFTSTGICSETAGVLAGKIRFTVAVPSSGDAFIARCMNTGTSSLATISMGSSQEVRLELSSSAGTSSFLATSACNLAVDTEYFIVARWHIANDDRFIACYNASGTLIDSNEDLTTDLAASAPGAFDVLRVGNPSSNANPIHVDNVFAATNYTELFQNFQEINSYQPTYSSGPTDGSPTTTTLPFSYTPDQDGTTYAAACTNGQTVTTFANLKAGTCSGGAAVGTGSDSASAGVSNTVTITGLVTATTYDVFIGHESGIGGQSTLSSLADRTTAGAAAPVFTSGPTVAAAADGFTISGTITCTGTCTVEAVACAPGDATPSNAEIEAGQCGGGNAALMNAQENWTTAVANDFLLTSSNKPVRFNVFIAGTDGTNDTGVTTATNQDRTIRTGFAKVVMASVATTGVCDQDSEFDPDCAVADVFEYEDDTNEAANCNVVFEDDGDFTLYDNTDGDNNGGLDLTDGGDDAVADCDGLRTFEVSFEDVSSATTGLFTAPATGNFTTDYTVYVNDTAPQCAIEDEIIVLTEDQAMDAQDFSEIGGCVDADGHALTYAVTVGTLPPGTTASGTGNVDWTGTPTTEDEGGEALTISVTDPAGESDTFSFTSYVINTWTVPNCDSNTLSECADEVVSSAPWRVDDPGVTVGGYSCGTGQPFLTVNAQSPASAAQATAFQAISVTLVAAIIPDLSGMTLAEAIAAIEAICP